MTGAQIERSAALEAAVGPDADAYVVVTVQNGRARVTIGGALDVVVGGKEFRSGDGVSSDHEIAWGVGSTLVIAATAETPDEQAAPRAATDRDVSHTGSYDFLWESTVRGSAPETRALETGALETGALETQAAHAVTPETGALETQAARAVTPEAADVTLAADTSDGEAEPPQPGAPHLVLSTGQRYPIDRGVVVGRMPSIRSDSAPDPVLVAVHSPQSDISRNHLGVQLEEGIVLVRDLDSTNGTRLLRLGQPAVRIPSDAPTLVRSGDVFDLGEGVTVTFEDLP